MKGWKGRWERSRARVLGLLSDLGGLTDRVSQRPLHASEGKMKGEWKWKEGRWNNADDVYLANLQRASNSHYDTTHKAPSHYIPLPYPSVPSHHSPSSHNPILALPSPEQVETNHSSSTLRVWPRRFVGLGSYRGREMSVRRLRLE